MVSMVRDGVCLQLQEMHSFQRWLMGGCRKSVLSHTVGTSAGLRTQLLVVCERRALVCSIGMIIDLLSQHSVSDLHPVADATRYVISYKIIRNVPLQHYGQQEG
jgi:hypothetical protein